MGFALKDFTFMAFKLGLDLYFLLKQAFILGKISSQFDPVLLAAVMVKVLDQSWLRQPQLLT